MELLSTPAGISLLILYSIYLTGFVSTEADFGYDENLIGPNHWAEHFHACSGKYQSPIEIDEGNVKNKSFPPLKFEGFNDLPMQTKITNTGHTVLLDLNHTTGVYIEGGPLKGVYTFEQLHFHWGQNDSVGSEDKINNHSYSMELHMVFYNEKYGSIKEAMDFKDGLAVLAIFYEAGDLDNEVYSEIVGALPKIEATHASYNLHKGFTLQNFLPSNVCRYFTYYGSLTTPPCLEVVTWIDFKHPTRLSSTQLSAFRKIKSTGGFMTHNYRPLQPLSDRVVYYNVDASHQDMLLPSSLIISATLLIAIFLM